MKITAFVLLQIFIYATSLAQTDLRLSSAFFQKTKEEYKAWLKMSSIGDHLALDKVDVLEDKVIAVLSSTHKGRKECDSLRGAWYALRKKYYHESGQPLHKAMLEKLCFQMDLPIDSAEIWITCPDSIFSVRIFAERSFEGILTVRFKEDKISEMGSDAIKIPVESMKDIFRSEQRKIENDQTIDVGKIRKAISTYFYDRYKSKGTWLWDARIDTSRTHYNEFVYKITHISGEVLKGKNLFEYHYIDVKVEQIGELITINWTFQAKYGGGLIYPPRESSSDYYDIDNSPYRSLLRDYEKELFLQLEEYLKKM